MAKKATNANSASKPASSKPADGSKAKPAANADTSKAENVTPTNTSTEAVGTAKAGGVNMPQLDPTDDSNVPNADGTAADGVVGGLPNAPEPTPPTVSSVAEDQDIGQAATAANGEDDTSAQDKLSEVHPNGQAPDDMPQGGEASTPRTDQKLPKEQASNLDLDGIEKDLLSVRKKVVAATSVGVRLTRNEFDQHTRIAALAQEVTNSLGNLR